MPESTGWDLPRIDVVDHVLRAGSTSCVTAPAAFVLQTEEGNPGSTNMSTTGYCVGNIKITTDGTSTFTADADGLVHQGVNEKTAAGLPLVFKNDDAIDIGGYQLVQANATLTYTIPSGTLIPSHGYVVVGRNATKAAFESFWGVTLASNVVYINSADTMPQINGSETYTLKNAGGTLIDGATVAMDATGGKSLQRANCGAVGSAGTWNKVASTSGTPGTVGLTGCAKGVFINEFRRSRHRELHLRVRGALQRQLTFSEGWDAPRPGPVHCSVVRGLLSLRSEIVAHTLLRDFVRHLQDGTNSAKSNRFPSLSQNKT